MESQNKSYYAVIPANVRYDKEISGNAKLLYGEITALTNEKGFCWASNSYFADLYDLSIRHISRMIASLERKGYIKSEILYDGKVFKERRIFLSTPIDKNVYTPGQKCLEGIDKNVHTPIDKNVHTPIDKNVQDNITVINNTLFNNTNNNTVKVIKEKQAKESQLEKEFAILWKMYPRKIGKVAALKSYIKARKVQKESYETVENGLQRYIDYLESQETEEQFIMHGSTWFNQNKWHDEYSCMAPKRKPKSAIEYLKMQYGEEKNEHRRNENIIEYYS